jgi:hypothetical protein
LWHKADVTDRTDDVRSWGQSRHRYWVSRSLLLTHLADMARWLSASGKIETRPNLSSSRRPVRNCASGRDDERAIDAAWRKSALPQQPFSSGHPLQRWPGASAGKGANKRGNGPFCAGSQLLPGPFREPAHKGFGSRRIWNMLANDFSGMVTTKYQSTAVVCGVIGSRKPWRQSFKKSRPNSSQLNRWSPCVKGTEDHQKDTHSGS